MSQTEPFFYEQVEFLKQATAIQWDVRSIVDLRTGIKVLHYETGK